MIGKPTPRRYFWMFFFAFLIACGKHDAILSPEGSAPIAVPPTPIPTATLLPITFIPTPLPTELTIPVLTPDAIQVERWKEYQTELAKLVLAQHSSQEIPFDETALCEWDILGRSGQEVYVWAICGTSNSGGTKPAVIYLETDGSIQDVKVPFHGSSWDSRIQELFPEDIQGKIYLYASSERSLELGKHYIYRQTHPETPPLIVLSAMPTTTPTP